MTMHRGRWSFALLILLLATPAWGQLPANVPQSLNDFIPPPEPPNLFRFVRDKEALEMLGKALFFDMSVGSDGTLACASCHFNAGADSRSKNQLSPGLLGGDSTFFPGTGPNYRKTLADHPHTQFLDPADRFSDRIRNNNDVTSSAGTMLRDFLGIDLHQTEDRTDLIPDEIFRVGRRNTRRVEPRNTPTVINAVYNITQFWDGRANFIFNGVNPFGCMDPDACVFKLRQAPEGPELIAKRIEIPFASLASQAVGPPLSDFEMSALNRIWPDIGKKMTHLRPLRQQLVHPNDSVLGPVSRSPQNGLSVTYIQLIKRAFKARWWRAPDHVIRFGPGGEKIIEPAPAGPLDPDQYTLMQANFSLFFGLAVMCYESTLISNESRFEKFLARTEVPTDEELLGMRIFFNDGNDPDPNLPAGKCADCHVGPLFSGATFPVFGVGVPGGEIEGLIERMPAAFHKESLTLRFNSDLANILPNEEPLDFDPRGTLVEVVPQRGGPGFAIVFPGTPGACDEDFRVTLFPQGQGGEVIPRVDVEFESDGDCNTSFDVQAANLDLGTWLLIVDGVVQGQLESLPPLLYDNGFYNIAVRPTEEDLLRGANGNPGGLPLSFTRLAQLGIDVTKGFPPIVGLVPSPSPAPNEPTGVDGAAKTPILLNVALTAPYMHNGGMATLREVVEFYNRGGNFHEHNIENLDDEIEDLGMTSQQIDAVVAFLHTLTDPRVANREAPFDTPELFINNGHEGDHIRTGGTAGQARDEIFHVPAVGADGGAPLPTYPNH